MHRPWKIDMSGKSTKSRKLLFRFDVHLSKFDEERVSFILNLKRNPVNTNKKEQFVGKFGRIKLCMYRHVAHTRFSWTEFKNHSRFKMRITQSGKSSFFDNDDNSEDGDEYFLAICFNRIPLFIWSTLCCSRSLLKSLTNRPITEWKTNHRST